MTKKIEWIKRGMTANNGLHMQEVCDQIAEATGNEKLYYKIATIEGLLAGYTFYFGYYSKNNTIPATANDLKTDILQGQNGTLRIPLFADYDESESISLVTPIDVFVSSTEKLSFDIIHTIIQNGVLKNTHSKRFFETYYHPINMTVFEV